MHFSEQWSVFRNKCLKIHNTILLYRQNTRGTHPFLTVMVLKIIDGLGVPLFTDAKEDRGQEPILSHDNKVYKEACQCLNHTDLTICHGDQPVGGHGRGESGKH